MTEEENRRIMAALARQVADLCGNSGLRMGDVTLALGAALGLMFASAPGSTDQHVSTAASLLGNIALTTFRGAREEEEKGAES